MSEYAGLWNEYGQCQTVKASDIGKPFIQARWYEGGIYATGVCAVEPGETDEQAAKRAYWHYVMSCYEDTFSFRRVELTSEPPAERSAK